MQKVYMALVLCALISLLITGCGTTTPQAGSSPQPTGAVAVIPSPAATTAVQVPPPETPAVTATTAAPGQKKPAGQQQTPGNAQGKAVDLVICLDTSNSMDALISSAKQKLWDIVNEVGTLKPRPNLRVALLSYGNDGYGNSGGWVRLDTDFTSDLDQVNEKLFALRTRGGTEYVARVLSEAIRNLSWNESKGALRMIFVAGNESAHQDKQLSIRSICSEALQKDIIVNAIFCGNQQQGDRMGWREVATIGGGNYFAIDQNKGTMVVKTPFDQQLADLSGELNKTYIAYGSTGRLAMENQAAQDSNARGMSSYAAASRAKAKSSELYNNKGWDLVDASKDKEFDMKSVKKQDLPAPMQAMNEKEQQEYVQKMKEKRETLQKEIKEISRQRDEYISKAQKEGGKSDSFDSALRSAISTQAVNKGFQKEK